MDIDESRARYHSLDSDVAISGNQKLPQLPLLLAECLVVTRQYSMSSPFVISE
jgi:hypothetical protein